MSSGITWSLLYVNESHSIQPLIEFIRVQLGCQLQYEYFCFLAIELAGAHKNSALWSTIIPDLACAHFRPVVNITLLNCLLAPGSCPRE